jgi:hypothetical protein
MHAYVIVVLAFVSTLGIYAYTRWLNRQLAGGGRRPSRRVESASGGRRLKG